MSVKVIFYANEKDFEEVSSTFYDYFCPDDWDYIIIGNDENEVDGIAYLLHAFDYKVKQIGEEWMAVTYHS